MIGAGVTGAGATGEGAPPVGGCRGILPLLLLSKSPTRLDAPESNWRDSNISPATTFVRTFWRRLADPDNALSHCDANSRRKVVKDFMMVAPVSSSFEEYGRLVRHSFSDELGDAARGIPKICWKAKTT